MSRRLAIALGLAAVTLAAYAPARHFDFVTWDDPVYVTQNAHVRRGLTADGVRWAFVEGDEGNWHPPVGLSHMLVVELFGLDPAAHHLTNVLLHVLNGLLLFFLLDAMTGAPWPSAFAAALFALHPLHVEPVAWVSARKDVLSTFFGLLAARAYVAWVQRGGAGRYAASAVLLALGLMAKSMLVTLPAVFLLLDYWPLGRLRLGDASPPPAAYPPAGGPRSLARLVVEKLPLFGLSAASVAVTLVVHVRSRALEPVAIIPFPARAANALVSYVRYVGKTLWPSDLAVWYPHPNLPGGTPWAAWQVAGAGLFLLGVSWLVVRARARPYLLVGWLWFLVTLLPVIGFVQAGHEAMADRFTYVPLVGLFIAVAWAGADLAGRSRARAAALGVAAAGVVVALAVGCRVQAGYWRDSITLYEHSLAAAPGTPMLLNNLGKALRADDRLDEAIVRYREALAIMPDYALAHYNLGNALDALGRFDEAADQYGRALAVNPAYAEAHNNLGVVLRKRGDLAGAAGHFREAVRLRPDYAPAYLNLADALGAEGRTQEALVEYRRAVEADPDFAAAHDNLGSALRAAGRLDEAIAHHRRAVALEPGFALAHNNLGNALRAAGHLDEAAAEYERALAADPALAEAHNNLGTVLKAQGRLDEAIAHYRRAVALKPDYAPAYSNLGNALLAQGRVDDAIAEYDRALAVDPAFHPARANREVARRFRAGGAPPGAPASAPD